MTTIDPSELDTQEFPLPMGIERLRPASSSVRVDVAALSDKGKVRDDNQDHYLIARAGRYLDTMLTNLPEGELPDRFEETSYVAIVADGMGGPRGRRGGEPARDQNARQYRPARAGLDHAARRKARSRSHGARRPLLS